jgi:transcriptional regulator of acetoin/glycerol metabolism
MGMRSLLDSPFAGLTPAQSKARIVEALKECDGNIRQAAVKLGVTRPTLYRYIEQLGIETTLERARKGAR